MVEKVRLPRRVFCGAASAALVTAAMPSAGLAKVAGNGQLRIGDMTIARLGYGAMRITGEGIWGEHPDPAACRAVLRRAVELGVEFIDTADSYGPEVSERLIAAALHPYPKGLVIATKGGFTRQGPNKWSPDGRPLALRQACEGSLRRLKLERIDLYQHHIPDPKLPYEDSIGELARLQKDGKIRHVGVSNVKPEQLAAARRILPVVSVQNRYNISDRGADAILATCERDGLAFIPWAPLGKSGRDSTPDTGARAALDAVAQKRRISAYQAQIVWLLSRSSVIVPIPGTASSAHLEENVAAGKLRFTANEMRRIG
jgi:pyridoxine 4-dehydrogenase